jgi:hypothetical protein
MIAERLPDCRPPRRDESLTSSSSHPELLSGYLAMRPRIHIARTPAERVVRKRWSRHAVGAAGLVLAAVLAVPVFKQGPNGGFEARASNDGFEARVQVDTFKSICAPWDEQASETIARIVQGRSDIDLQRVSDAISRMRRARRLCESGWVRLACLDYDAVIRGVATFDHSGPAPPICWPTMLDPPAGFMTRR